jgi:hypothetical protein
MNVESAANPGSLPPGESTQDIIAATRSRPGWASDYQYLGSEDMSKALHHPAFRTRFNRRGPAPAMACREHIPSGDYQVYESGPGLIITRVRQ